MTKKSFINKEGKTVEITFSVFRDGDEDGLKSCIEDYYGDGYPYKKYFKKGFLSEKTKAGKMAVICGKTADGTIVSTSAIAEAPSFSGSAILTLRVVRSNLRGLGIGTFQEELLFDIIKNSKARLKIRSLFADVMVNNLVSQNSLGKRDFVFCGIRPMLYRADIMLPHDGYDSSVRLSQAVMVKGNHLPEELDIFVPDEEAPFITDIYSRLGAKIIKKTGIPSPTLEKTDFLTEEQEIHSSSVYIVKEVGKDFDELTEKSLSQKELSSFIVYLNLKSSGADSAYKLLKDSGFCFTGMKPLNTGAEYIIMSHTFGKDLDTRCVMVRGQDEAFFDMIKANILSRRADK